MKQIEYEYDKEVIQQILPGLEITVFVGQDDCSCDPRKEWDNFGTMVCWHRRYNLGDRQTRGSYSYILREIAMDTDPAVANRIEYWEYGPGAFTKHADDKITRIVENAMRDVAVLPLYIYDHSGITMNTTGFSCPWDSGQVGVIYATRDQILKEFDRQRLTRRLIDEARRILRAEVETYNDYLTGNVHGYSVTITRVGKCGCCGHRLEDSEFEDSCWGFYGDIDYMLSEINDGLKGYGIEIVH